MSEATTSSTVLVMAFDDADKAKDIYKSVQSAEKEHAFDIQDLVLVTKDEKGKAHIADARHRATKRGAIQVAPLASCWAWV